MNRRSNQEQGEKREKENSNPSINDENVSQYSEDLDLSELTIQSSVVRKAVNPSLDGSVND